MKKIVTITYTSVWEDDELDDIDEDDMVRCAFEALYQSDEGEFDVKVTTEET